MSSKTLTRKEALQSLFALGAGYLAFPLSVLNSRYSIKDLDIGDYCQELFLSLEQLSFDNKGYLQIHGSKWYDRTGHLNPPTPPIGRANVKPTDFNLASQSASYNVSDVSLLVLHSDDAPRIADSGLVRTAQNTLYGLNDWRKVSVHFCVDELPICLEGKMNEPEGYYPGYGILQTQQPSGDVSHPYRGRHISIASDDHARQLTLGLFKRLGIDSNFAYLADKSELWLDKHSIGIEMVGKQYDALFPRNFPPLQQVSNAISLAIAIVNRYTLSPWDVVGHLEVQEKTDPGNAFMLLTRYCLGIAGLTGAIPYQQIFAGEKPEEYFRKISSYFEGMVNSDNFYRYRDANAAPAYLDIQKSLIPPDQFLGE